MAVRITDTEMVLRMGRTFSWTMEADVNCLFPVTVARNRPARPH